MVFDRDKIERENKRLKKELNKKESKESSILKGKLLSKPKVEIRKVDVIKHLKNMTHENHESNETETYENMERAIKKDNRSLFFNDEFIKEKKEGNKWLK
jgi:phosphoenolpyruvate synthase/pyruvate phosphate dikinase